VFHLNPEGIDSLPSFTACNLKDFLARLTGINDWTVSSIHDLRQKRAEGRELLSMGR